MLIEECTPSSRAGVENGERDFLFERGNGSQISFGGTKRLHKIDTFDSYEELVHLMSPNLSPSNLYLVIVTPFSKGWK